MKKLSKMDWIKIILVAVVVIFAAFYIIKNNSTNTTKNSETKISTSTVSTSPSKSNTVTAKTSITNTSGAGTVNTTSKCNIKVTYPTIYSAVSVPFTVNGILNLSDTSEGCMWSQNLSRAGDAQIFYDKNGAGWMPAGTSVPIIESGTGNSTTTLDFSVSFNLNATALGLTSGTPIKIVFTELNVMNKPNPETFEYEVYLK
jgi:hypothetical protein